MSNRESGGEEHPGVHDMIVPLLSLPESRPLVERLAASGIVIRRARTMEMKEVVYFVDERWDFWTDAVSSGFAGPPCRVFIAIRGSEPVGFAAYDVDFPGVFGPTGVAAEHHGQGIGAALLLRCLEAMRETGYLYAIIGAVGPAEFYTRVAGAMSLPAEWPNYTDSDRETLETEERLSGAFCCSGSSELESERWPRA